MAMYTDVYTAGSEARTVSGRLSANKAPTGGRARRVGNAGRRLPVALYAHARRLRRLGAFH